MTAISGSVNNRAKIRVSGVVYEIVFDVSQMTGEAIETIEEHLGGEPFMMWLERLARDFTAGIGVKQLRARDIIAIVYLARSQTESGLAWTDVSRSIAPYTLTLVPDEPAAVRPVADVRPPSPAISPLGVPLTS